MTRQADRTIATSERRRRAIGETRLFKTRTSLAACVRGFVVRRVDGAVDAEHFSRFPATASCSVSWVLDGSVVRLTEEQASHERIVFRGPQTKPVIARHRGPLHIFIVLLAPDALCFLTGAGADRYLNRTCSLASALDDSWQAMASDVLHAPTDEERVRLVEEFLEPRWHAVRSRSGALSWGPAHRHGEWSRAAMSRAGTIAKGRSRRQFERHMRSMTGWPARALRGLARAENALLIAARSAQRHVNWANVAAEAGYADQSHLGRDVRRYTGFSPQQLWSCMPNDEALWVYRVWFGRNGDTAA